MMQKTRFTLFFAVVIGSLLTLASGFADSEGKINWYVDYEKAAAAAKAENKPMMLYFTGSEWCPACVITDKRILSQKVFVDYANSNLIMVKIDFTRFGNPVARDFAGQHNALYDGYEIEGFPSLVLLTPEGDLVKKAIAIRRGGPEEYVEFLKDSLAGKK